MDDRTCSSKWPRYALYVYSSLSVAIGGALIGTAIYCYKNFTDIQDMFKNTFKSSATDDFDIVMFMFATSIVIGVCMVLTSVTFSVYGAYRMNRSCVAAYMTFLIFGLAMAIAVGLVVVTHEPQFLEDIANNSSNKDKERGDLDFFTRVMMIVTLSLAAFQMVGVMFSCCLQKAIEDMNK